MPYGPGRPDDIIRAFRQVGKMARGAFKDANGDHRKAYHNLWKDLRGKKGSDVPNAFMLAMTVHAIDEEACKALTTLPPAPPECPWLRSKERVRAWLAVNLRAPH